MENGALSFNRALAFPTRDTIRVRDGFGEPSAVDATVEDFVSEGREKKDSQTEVTEAEEREESKRTEGLSMTLEEEEVLTKKLRELGYIE